MEYTLVKIWGMKCKYKPEIPCPLEGCWEDPMLTWVTEFLNSATKKSSHTFDTCVCGGYKQLGSHIFEENMIYKYSWTSGSLQKTELKDLIIMVQNYFETRA